ncbi:similar to neuropathy target esterase homolog (predicted), isoform CRA_b [Rattus norvegicus]|uniref:Similar to neuropathy target esterase homolog (Predicted), isoform CRA_b n=1 Tax=Rattus norvegicus TaxID=10116 RepID=A6KQ08_RAT|nr:similar to neuropathy target esterase homolog (predicted), isoform CRA_b [Rattus norvegicus]
MESLLPKDCRLPDLLPTLPQRWKRRSPHSGNDAFCLRRLGLSSRCLRTLTGNPGS